MIPKQTSPARSNPSSSHHPPPGAAAAAALASFQSSSPRFFFSTAFAANPSASSHRRIAIAVDLSDESAYVVRWAVQNYLRPGDAVILLHVRPTSVLYGADWGSMDLSVLASSNAPDAMDNEVPGFDSEESRRKLEEDFDAFTTNKAKDLAQPLVEAQIPFKIHIVKDHDMKERLCLEVERLDLSAVIIGSRGFGASKRTAKSKLGSVSDYCARHCICPVVVVRYPDKEAATPVAKANNSHGGAASAAKLAAKEAELHPVAEEEECHDQKD